MLSARLASSGIQFWVGIRGFGPIRALSADLGAVPDAGELLAPARLPVQEVVIGRLPGKDLVRVEESRRVEDVLQAVPPADRLGAVLEDGELALQRAQAVLSRDGAAELDRVPKDLSGQR